MLGGVRQCKDHGPIVDSRHRLDHFLIERATNRADADDGGGLDALDRSDEIPRRRVLVCIRLLEIDEVLAGRLQQTVDVEHVYAGLRFLEAHALRYECRTEQVSKANTGRAG